MISTIIYKVFKKNIYINIMIDWLLPLAIFSLNSLSLFQKFLIFLELFDKRASNFNKYQWKIEIIEYNT